MRYNGPSAVTFLLEEPGVRTPFGDLVLEKIDVVRKTHRNRVDIYLLFHVDAGHGQAKVMPLRHLFRFVLPDVVRRQVVMMGASEESLNENVPSSFDMGAGAHFSSLLLQRNFSYDSAVPVGTMSFDEEYARWLQHLYETDLSKYCHDMEWKA